MGPKRTFQRVQQLNEESRPIGEAAAVMIRAPVEPRLEKLHGQRVVACGNLEEIESGRFGALAGFDVHVDHGADVGFVHFAAVDGSRGEYGRQPLARGTAELARLERRRIAAAVPELNAGEAAMFMRHLAHIA